MRNETDIYKKIANDDSIEHFIERSILNDILNSAYDLEKIQPDATIPDFLRFIDHLESFDVETKRGVKGSNSVQVSTIHQSKGLEFQVVFVIDVAQGRMPGRFTQKPFYVPLELAKGVKPAAEPKEEFTREERRLLYVAMTRAITHLFLSYPTQYENRVRANKPSPFLAALEPEQNTNVNFLKATSNVSAADALTFDAVQVIKNEAVDGVIKHVSNGLYESAIKKIIDLAAIDHFQKNKTTDGFDANNIFTLDPSADLEDRLNGTSSTSLKFGKQNLSFSKISNYVNCPKQFWYGNVLNALPENQEAPALYKGGFFHKIVENSSIKQRDEGKTDSLSVLKKQVTTNWDPTQYLGRSVKKEQQDKKSLDFALDSYQKWTSSSPNTILELEMRFSIHAGGYQINGVIDRVEQTPDGDYVIVDYKTGHTTPSKVPDSLQLNIYCIAIQEKFGKLPIRASFFYVEEPEGGQWFHYDVTAKKVAEVKQKLEEHITAISNDEYDANPGFICKWCDYRDICEEAM
jgi:DNA helicase-2/ATP-dependent DNA helicase PcrA